MPESFLNIQAWAFQLDESALSPIPHHEDASRAAQIADPERRRRYERGRSALRQVLASQLRLKPADVAFEIAPGGKPKVTGCEFSLSHSGPWLVVVVSGMAVGVDIETPRRRKNTMALAERFFSARDFRFLRETDDAQRDGSFLRQWVAKEAALKCDGVGLALHLHKAECVMDKSAVRGVRWDEERFSIHEFALPDGTPGAVAWRGDGGARVEWRDAAEINVS